MQTIEGAYLASTFHPRSLPAPTAEELWHGTPKLVHPRLSIFITVANASGLTGLRHEMTFSWRGGNVQVDGPVVQCQQRTVAVIGTPMAGAGWLSMETSIPTSHHMLTQVTVNNVTRCVQRYAVDYMMMANDMSMFANDGSNNSDWYGYGKDLLAVADGVVTEVYGGVWENVPRHKNTNLTFEQAGGNMVIIDIGGGNYAQYAHLILGSATVRVGDHVTKGQIIGKLGNSGNSDAPHLHFQIGSDPHSILASEGYPFYYDRFDLDGTLITDQQTGPIEIVTYVPPVLWEASWFKNYQLTDFGQRILVGAL
jgi:hypothetical protein